MVIEHYTKGNDGKWVLELHLTNGCWTKQMKQQAEKHYFDVLGDIFSEIKFGMVCVSVKRSI